MLFTDPETCTEEAASGWLYLAGRDDADVRILSFQAVDGKGYFASDVKLRLADGVRMEPDLIASEGTSLWLVEVKATHQEALEDEVKLAKLRQDLGDEEILAQVARRSHSDTSGLAVVTAIAYCLDDVGDADCDESVIHIDLSAVAGESTLGEVFRSHFE